MAVLAEVLRELYSTSHEVIYSEWGASPGVVEPPCVHCGGVAFGCVCTADCLAEWHWECDDCLVCSGCIRCNGCVCPSCLASEAFQ